MKITGIEVALFQPTWDDPFAARFQRVLAALTIRTDDGVAGIGRTTGDAARAIKDHLEPALLGQDPRRLEHLWSTMDRVTIPLLGREPALMAAIGAVNIALWDLFGKVVGAPCWRLLGGYRSSVQAYADIPIRNETPEELGEQLAGCVAHGYRAVKFHILQRDPEHIIAETRAARAAIGPDVALMVDVFRALDPQTAIAVAQRLEEFDLTWLEEPVRWHDQPLGLALVAGQTRIPIAGGEGEATIFGCRRLLEQQAVRYLQTDTVGGGGYTNLRKIAALAEAFHVKLAPHGATIPELTAPLVAAVPNGALVPATTPDQPPAVWGDLYEDFRIDNGEIRLSDRPGLGLRFNRDYLAHFAVGRLD